MAICYPGVYHYTLSVRWSLYPWVCIIHYINMIYITKSCSIIVWDLNLVNFMLELSKSKMAVYHRLPRDCHDMCPTYLFLFHNFCRKHPLRRRIMHATGTDYFTWYGTRPAAEIHEVFPPALKLHFCALASSCPSSTHIQVSRIMKHSNNSNNNNSLKDV